MGENEISKNVTDTSPLYIYRLHLHHRYHLTMLQMPKAITMRTRSEAIFWSLFCREVFFWFISLDSWNDNLHFFICIYFNISYIVIWFLMLRGLLLGNQTWLLKLYFCARILNNLWVTSVGMFINKTLYELVVFYLCNTCVLTLDN